MQGIADYRFVRRLGDGNHGTFWLATAPARLGLGEIEVAVKTLDLRASDDDFRRFANELKCYAAVQAPELVRLLDAGHAEGRLFYAAEYHPAGSLAEPAGTPTTADVVAAVADAARAAHALHDVGVAHRDIKPGNIMYTATGGKLGDLGLAQVLRPGTTVTGIGPVGAVEFMAPEIVRGDKAGRASDIWALGASLHRTVTGVSIFPGLPEADLLEVLRHVAVTPPSLSPGFDARLAPIVERATDVDPAERYPTAAAMAADLDAWSMR